jgi:3-oxo-5alpha-steroid 4-dehydrogenase
MFGGLWGFQRVPALVLMFAGAKRAATMEALAHKMGADQKTLAQSLDQYNSAAAAGDDPLGKSADLMQALASPPFYALNISADMRVFPCPALTLGGLCVDETTGAVRTADGNSISGLYAAGRAAVGIASNHYVSGLALADCIWSGRRAGGSAAASAAALKERAQASA